MSKSQPDELEWLPQAKRQRTWIVRAAIALGALGVLVLYVFRPPALHDPVAVAACLPRGITLSTVAEYRPTGTMSWQGNTKEFDYNAVTVERKLAEIGARARGGKLYDPDGREIRLFRPSGGGGAPPAVRVMEAEHRELQRLKSLYRVIELATYNPRNPPA